MRARRRERLLLAPGAEEDVAPVDSLGNFKRRVSDADDGLGYGEDMGVSTTFSSPGRRRRGGGQGPTTDGVQSDDGGRDNNNGGELVYLHHVKPRDTAAGVVIQYHCQPSVFRRANRLWPNDPIQSRRTVVLPVHACAVKGRPLPDKGGGGPGGQRPDAGATAAAAAADDEISSEDLLLSSSDLLPEIPPLSSNSNPFRERQQQRADVSSGSPLPSGRPPTEFHNHDDNDDPPWVHESWVLLDGQAAPVEIVRMKRKALGYFLPRRRQSRSVVESAGGGGGGVGSNGGSASNSFDLPRRLLPLPAGESHSPHSRHQRSQTRSDASTTLPYFAQRLHGPGGVGTLGAGAHSPGPAQDPLNRYLAPHLHLPHLPHLHLPGVMVGTQPAHSPRESFDSAATATVSNSNGSSSYYHHHHHHHVPAGLENVGSAIEGWVKRVALRAAAALAENAAVVIGGGGGGDEGKGGGGGSGIGSGGGGGGSGSGDGGGDLIELLDGLDPAPVAAATAAMARRDGVRGETAAGAAVAADDDDDTERALRERFPMRRGGRQSANGSGGGGGGGGGGGASSSSSFSFLAAETMMARKKGD